jgi:hypothetical protein
MRRRLQRDPKCSAWELEVAETPHDTFLEVSIGGKSPADLTESALRTVLFGERNTLADQHMGFAAEISDPLVPLRQSPVSEEIVRPISELLVTDILVGTGRARRVASFRLGVSIRGRRRLALSWEPTSRYSNEPVTIRSIEGDVSI